ncbi:MAG TPA: hypothetical protein VGH80_02940 [Xanthomonadaceae bacterium]|jgi:hypothetical protein
MKRTFWHDLAPSAVLALGIVAGQAAQSALNDAAGTSVLAFSLLCADALSLRMRRMPARPSPAAEILAIAFVFAGCLALQREPGHDGSLIPLLGMGAWTVFFTQRRTSCTNPVSRFPHSGHTP